MLLYPINLRKRFEDDFTDAAHQCRHSFFTLLWTLREDSDLLGSCLKKQNGKTAIELQLTQQHQGQMIRKPHSLLKYQMIGDTTEYTLETSVWHLQ